MGITQYYKQKEYPSLDVIPAKAGIQCFVWFPASAGTSLDSRFHGNDKKSRCRIRSSGLKIYLFFPGLRIYGYPASRFPGYLIT
jgi:hypothetical protein